MNNFDIEYISAMLQEFSTVEPIVDHAERPSEEDLRNADRFFSSFSKEAKSSTAPIVYADGGVGFHWSFNNPDVYIDLGFSNGKMTCKIKADNKLYTFESSADDKRRCDYFINNIKQLTDMSQFTY